MNIPRLFVLYLHSEDDFSARKNVYRDVVGRVYSPAQHYGFDGWDILCAWSALDFLNNYQDIFVPLCQASTD